MNEPFRLLTFFPLISWRSSHSGKTDQQRRENYLEKSEKKIIEGNYRQNQFIPTKCENFPPIFIWIKTEVSF